MCSLVAHFLGRSYIDVCMFDVFGFNLQLQALYYWLRTYLMERRDVANKSDMSRSIALQRMQHAMSVAATGSSHSGNVPAPDGNPRSATGHHGGPGAIPDSHSNEGGSNLQGQQEVERSGPSDGGGLHDNQHNISDGGGSMQLRRTNNAGGATNLVASAVSAFEAAKEIMEALRNKHTNLASELEVYTLFNWSL